ncbi:MAG: LapA family protein [Deltaproteobacteria bacterium]|nr:LapA family protein [Deltaproteobacteria bacterium]
MKYLQALLVLLLALVLAGFIQQNAETTVLNYFSWHSVGLPLSLFMIVAFGLGYLAAVIIGFSGDIRSRFRLFKAERETKRLKGELAKRETAFTGESADSPVTEKAEPDTQAPGTTTQEDETAAEGTGEERTETI